MKTLINCVKDYDKNFVFKDCQMHVLYIYLRRKEILLIFFRHFVERPVKNQPLLDYFWDISRDWERLQRTTTRICKGDWPMTTTVITSNCQCFIHKTPTYLVHFAIWVRNILAVKHSLKCDKTDTCRCTFLLRITNLPSFSKLK